MYTNDELLARMTAFWAGHRTLQGYGEFAWQVRELSNRLAAGGVLPARWALAARPAGLEPSDEVLMAIGAQVMMAVTGETGDGYTAAARDLLARLRTGTAQVAVRERGAAGDGG
jgi:hypothetical protein